jgi:hypothetical protein
VCANPEAGQPGAGIFRAKFFLRAGCENLRSMRNLMVLSVLVLASACANMNGPARVSDTRDANLPCPSVPNTQRWARTELYFGLSKPDGSLIAEDDFQRFLDSEVTPRFRNGFSVIAGRGQFLSETGALVEESSRVLVLLYPSDQQTSTSVEDIRNAYKKRFQQESVMRVDDAECVAF